MKTSQAVPFVWTLSSVVSLAAIVKLDGRDKETAETK